MQDKKFRKDDLDALCVLIEEEAREKKDRQIEVTTQNVQNSMGSYTGILIRDMELVSSGVSYACPVFRADQVYDTFALALSQEKDKLSALRKTAQSILDMYEKTPGIKNVARLAEKFKSWDELKKDVILRVVGKKKRKEYLKDKPHAVMGDICAIYGVEIDLENGVGFAAISNDTLKNLNVSVKKMHEVAAQNTMEKYPMKAIPLANFIPFADVSTEDMPENNTAYVLTNEKAMNGASCLFYQDFKESLTRALPEGGALLPSSRHELLYVPCEDNETLRNFEQMVREINAAEVDPADQLSDNPFIFDGIELKPAFGDDAFKVKFKEGKKKEKTR